MTYTFCGAKQVKNVCLCHFLRLSVGAQGMAYLKKGRFVTTYVDRLNAWPQNQWRVEGRRKNGAKSSACTRFHTAKFDVPAFEVGEREAALVCSLKTLRFSVLNLNSWVVTIIFQMGGAKWG